MFFPVIEYLHVQNSFAHIDTKIKFLAGKNYIVGPNGSGKTELLELIAFAFFGSASLRDVRTAYKKLKVEMVFNFAGSKFKINRTIGDAILSLEEDKKFVPLVNSNSYVNSKIIALLGYDLTVYKLSNYCEQDELQYISKMGPAKRIQFIDKVSGIEDAKELSAFVDNRRKLLVSETNILKRLLIKPTDISDEVLLVDYKEQLQALDRKILYINDINTQLAVLKSKVSYLANKPQLPTYYNSRYGEMLPEAHLELSDAVKTMITYESEIDDLNSNISKLSLSPKYTKYTMDDVTQSVNALENNRRLIVKEKLLSNGKSICPSCTHEYHLSFDLLKEYDDVSEHVAPLLGDNACAAISNYFKFDEAKIKDYELKLSDVKLKLKKLLHVWGLYDLESLTLNTVTKNYTSNIQILKEHTQKMTTWTLEVQELENNKLEISKLENILKDNDLSTLFQEKEIMIRNQTLKDKYILELESYLRSKTLYDELMLELKTLVEVLKIIKESSEEIKNNSIPLINYHASLLLNQMTNGELLSIKVLDNYDILVDGYDIKLKSGSEKDIASLAFRLSLGSSVIPGMMKLFIGDEIDHSSTIERTEYITEALDKIGEEGYQIILISHKSLDNIEDGNIIDLSKL